MVRGQYRQSLRSKLMPHVQEPNMLFIEKNANLAGVTNKQEWSSDHQAGLLHDLECQDFQAWIQRRQYTSCFPVSLGRTSKWANQSLNVIMSTDAWLISIVPNPGAPETLSQLLILNTWSSQWGLAETMTRNHWFIVLNHQEPTLNNKFCGYFYVENMSRSGCAQLSSPHAEACWLTTRKNWFTSLLWLFACWKTSTLQSFEPDPRLCMTF